MSILAAIRHPDVARRLVIAVNILTVAGAFIASQVTARPVEAKPASTAARMAAGPHTAMAAPDLTVVELFTSQGCSSCPPANANLTRLAARPDVLALSFGVTYWDQLGWTDTFGNPAYTARQRAYQTGLGHNNVWTPQVVVDGRADVVGQTLGPIEDLIRRHRRFDGPMIAFRGDGVGLAGGAPVAGPADVWLVRYDPRVLDVPVQRGENGGRTLPHVDVVRQLVRLGGWTGVTVGYRLPLPPSEDLRTAVLVQRPNGGPILAAARL